MKKKTDLMIFVIVSSLIPFFLGCSGRPSPSTPTEESLYLTPIPQSTLDSFVMTPPITSKMQAVIIARRELSTTRLEFTAPPGVISVEEMSLADAIRVTGFPSSSTNDLIGDTRAWLVVFEGDYRIVPPDPMHTYTPEPAGHGCAAVIVMVSSALPGGAGTLNCPTEP
ncbi:MAG TPA: hypothetical protein VLD65_13325 [Anaerolineales bacterium]|nr:hypothetical protein [Anaerolineales bacterium]